MEPVTLVIGGLILLAVGEGFVIKFQRDKIESERTEHQEAAQEAAGALAACEERAVPETVQASAQGTTDALTAALAPEMASMEARVLLVQAIPQAELARAVIATGSPQSIAAHAALAGCWAANTTGDSARSGCATKIPEAWFEAVSALPACSEPVPLVVDGGTGE